MKEPRKVYYQRPRPRYTHPSHEEYISQVVEDMIERSKKKATKRMDRKAKRVTMGIKPKYNPKKCKLWWTPECSEAIRIRENARKRNHQKGTAETREICAIFRMRAKEVILSAKREGYLRRGLPWYDAPPRGQRTPHTSGHSNICDGVIPPDPASQAQPSNVNS